MSNDFHKTSLLKNSWIGNFRHYAKDFIENNWGMKLCLKASSCVLTFPYICLYTGNQPWTANASKNSSQEKYRGMYWKFTTGRFLAQLHPSNFFFFFFFFFFVKILLLEPKVSNWWLFQKRCFTKIFDIGFPYKHCYFRRRWYKSPKNDCVGGYPD